MNPFIASVQLRWTDLDAYGHVNNVMVADYLQQARAQFLMSGPAHALLEEGCVVVGHQINYRAAMNYASEPIRVELGISELGAARFEVAYRLLQDDQLCVEARTVLCPFDFETQLPRRLDAVERDYLGDHRVKAQPLPGLRAPVLAGRGSRIEVYPRWSDPDRYGHVNNVRYLDYVLAGRIDMTAGADPSMARAGMGDAFAGKWLVVRQDIDYLVQLEYRLTPYLVFTAPVRIGDSSVVLATEIVDPQDDTVHARARVVLVHAGDGTAKVPLPDSARTALEAMLVSD